MPTPIDARSPPPRASPCVWNADTSGLLRERGVEGDGGRREVGAPDELQRLARAPLAIHSRVLPFDRQRAVVADPIERPDHRVEVDVAVAGGDEVPAAPG